MPGIIEEPGSFDGSRISPMPDLGPLASHLISFAILKREPARPLKADDKDTIES